MNFPNDYLIPGIEPFHVEEAGIIYNCDCRDILPLLPPVDLVLTDPPYVNLTGGIELTKKCGGVAQPKHSTTTVGDLWFANFEWAKMINCKNAFIFCGYNSVVDTREAFQGYKTKCLVTWYKRNSSPMLRNVPKYNTEFVWGISRESGLDWGNLKTVMFDIPNKLGVLRLKD